MKGEWSTQGDWMKDSVWNSQQKVTDYNAHLKEPGMYKSWNALATIITKMMTLFWV